MYTQECMEDERYSQDTPISKKINNHPKEWLRVFGPNKPAVIAYNVAQLDLKLKMELYPSYCPYDGWQWVTKEKQNRRRMIYESV